MARFYQNKDISIMCPNCGKFLIKSNKKDMSIHKVACKRCGKWIWFIPGDKDYAEIKSIPKRVSSSGKRFY